MCSGELDIYKHNIVDSDLYNNVPSELSLGSQPVVDYPVEIPGQRTTQ